VNSPLVRRLLLVQCFLCTFVFAELTHRGIIGEPFNGTVNDSTHRVQVQVGSFANLVDVSGLHASAVKNRIASGSASQLRTNYLLDDDTIMEIDPSNVSWIFDSPDLQFEENSLLAQYVDKRRMVRVRASGMGFESSFTVFILPGKPSTEEDSFDLPDALRAAVKLEQEGWHESDWFGVFYDAGNGWIFHTELGWLTAVPSADSSTTAWFWSESQEWLWTGDGIYPHLFRNRDTAWLYFFKQALPSILLYNYQTEKVEKYRLSN
jgi:hypothetical protein